ncbi:hypothetical protein T11_15157 [Trichinella zimbabwensis]|uniref:Uncharacterized protein n=1 Tax=Trichinella zimbabwensis TaxID=268475 RepID=A0A0V1H6T8_9BILA|nr:hypothetical protein T11_15157 [Trichinella zimbabwensis]
MTDKKLNYGIGNNIARASATPGFVTTTCAWRDVCLCVSFVCESETQCPLAAAVACTNGVCRRFLQMLKHKFTTPVQAAKTLRKHGTANAK